jgi:uncharacterized protein (TIGR02466 family)
MSEMFVDYLFATPVAKTTIGLQVCEHYSNVVTDLLGDFDTVIETTDDNLHKRQEFLPLVNEIEREAKKYCEEIIGVKFEDVALTCMWSNAHKSGGTHGFHMHPNSFFSGVLYLQVPNDGDVGMFSVIDPRQTKNFQMPDYIKETCLSDRSKNIPPVTGQLLFFPSWLLHGTGYFNTNTNKKRISLSFNYTLLRSTQRTASFNFAAVV